MPCNGMQYNENAVQSKKKTNMAITTQYNTLHCTTIQHNTIPYNENNAMQCDAIQEKYNRIQHNTKRNDL